MGEKAEAGSAQVLEILAAVRAPARDAKTDSASTCTCLWDGGHPPAHMLEGRPASTCTCLGDGGRPLTCCTGRGLGSSWPVACCIERAA
eukprot:321507-Chlamydomonas_euryale.AAC.5